MAIVSAARGLAMQYRAAAGGSSANAGLRDGGAMRWLRLTRSGNTFVGAISDDGLRWSTLGSVTIPMSSTVYVGVAVTSHDASRTTLGRFDDIAIER
jgi:regulation of enolase protein 1 (concanavalin A-like superfamily)